MNSTLDFGMEFGSKFHEWRSKLSEQSTRQARSPAASHAQHAFHDASVACPTTFEDSTA